MKNKWIKPLLRRRIVVALLILLQVAFFVYFLVSSSYLSSALSAIFVGISFFVALFVASGEGENAYKLTWCIVILSPRGRCIVSGVFRAFFALLAQ